MNREADACCDTGFKAARALGERSISGANRGKKTRMAMPKVKATGEREVKLSKLLQGQGTNRLLYCRVAGPLYTLLYSVVAASRLTV